MILDVTTFGAGPHIPDSTAAIQSAINHAGPGGVVCIPPGVFMVDPDPSKCLKMCPGVILRMSTGTVLKAIHRPSPIYIVILAAVPYATITGGCIVGDRDRRTEDGSAAAGFGISIGSHNVTVSNVSVYRCWGDGICVDGGTAVTIDRVRSDHNRRHAMSVIQANGVKITNSGFYNHGPAHPGCGIDFECDHQNQTIEGVVLENCAFGDNQGASVSFGAPGTYRNIRVDNCQFDCKTQPILVTGNAGSLGTPWWAWLINRTVGSYGSPQNALPGYRWLGYPTSWSKA